MRHGLIALVRGPSAYLYGCPPMTTVAAPPAVLPDAQRRWPEGWACALTGATGIATILVLLALRAVEPLAGVCALVAIAAITALLARKVRQEARQPALDPPTGPGDLERRAALAGALESLPDPLLVISALESEALAAGRVVFANAAARDFLRIQGEGAPLTTAIRHPEVLSVVDEALFGRIPAETAYEAGGAQGRFWRAIARPLPSVEAGSCMALLMLSDETDSRRNERMRADFLANASHELRTPLASLAGFIETLRGHAKDDPAARERFLEIMAAQADRMSRLVADLMSLSRIELNEHIPPSGCVDVAMTVTDVADALAPQAAAAGVAIRPQLPALGSAMVVGDRDQIVQVVQNLVDNGIKYAGAGGAVTVEVEVGVPFAAAITPRQPTSARLSLLTPDRTDGAWVVMRVSDTGPGIPREYLPRLTERFYRVEGQKSGDRAGTGLGLAIVKHVMNRHRGGMVVEAGDGRGAAFVVYFPAAIRRAAPEADEGRAMS